ncbi:MAG: endonuclease [Ignavibacteriales bacterium]|nr:endonuclease [Ignavibacteriales bacterium]
MKKFLFLILFPFVISFAQISIAPGIEVTENFNSLLTIASATLPAHWKVDKLTSVRTVGNYSAAGNTTNYAGGTNLSLSAGNGIYNFGIGAATTATDRAIGGLSSGGGSQSVNIYSYFKNTGTQTLTQVDLSYDVMRFRNGSNAAGFSIQLYYSTNGTTWTSADSNFVTSFPTNIDNTGSPTVPIETKKILNQPLSGLSILQNGSFYLAFNYSVTTGTTTSNAQAIGIDNFVMNNIGGTTTAPNATAALAASNITATSFTANWNSSASATSYLLDVSTSSDFSNFITDFENKDAGNITSATVTSLMPGTKYYYRVKAKNSFGTSDTSNSISVTTLDIITHVQFNGISDAVAKSNGVYNLELTITDPDVTNATTCSVIFISDSSTAKTSYLNNDSTWTVIFPAGSSANQNIALTISDNGISEIPKKAYFLIQNVTGGSLAHTGSISNFRLSITSGTDNSYYTTITQGLTGEELKTELHNLIKNNSIKFSYDYVWTMDKAADEDPKNYNNVIGIYSGISMAKNQQANIWNREHVWSKSHGDFGTDIGAGTDGHHLRPENSNVNSLKSNLDFDNGGNLVPNGGGSKYIAGTSWEPRDETKGDVARMIFYMATRYNGDVAGEPNLQIVNYVPSPDTPNDSLKGFYGKLSTLLQWNLQDPPDAFEMNRNNVIYYYQHNRNPYIDHPEWITSIWGLPNDVKENYGDQTISNFVLYQNYPNPFNPSTVISYQLPTSSFVSLKVFDILGREIIRLINGVQNAGLHNTTFSSLNSKLTSGIYIYTINARSVSGGKEFHKSAKFVLLK